MNIQKYFIITVTISIKLIRFRKAMNVNLSLGNDESSVVSEIIRMSISLLTISTSESSLFLKELMFN